MDERTPDEKFYDTALRSERRTIGHRMSRKVMVIAPTHREAQIWGDRHGIVYSDLLYVNETNWHLMQGMTGVEHVILQWSHFSDIGREEIRRMLKVLGSPPFEGEDNSEPYCADPVRV